MKVVYQQLTPLHWKSYRFIDSGNFEKLEQFGTVILRRPEPQAIWSPLLTEKEWKSPKVITFKPSSSHSGEWSGNNLKENWQIEYPLKGHLLKFHLSLTKFKHVGIFPEQAENWEYIYQKVSHWKSGKVLNLFAYTGGASVAAAIANPSVQVTHLDAIKQVVGWAKVNAELNQVKNIRWIIDDALAFVKREIRRGNSYEGIIMDPPAFGHGPHGEKWKLEENLNELIKLISKILNPNYHFFVLNTYSLNFSPILLENLVRIHFKDFQIKKLEIGDLFLESQTGQKLPMGVFCRFCKEP